MMTDYVSQVTLCSVNTRINLKHTLTGTGIINYLLLPKFYILFTLLLLYYSLSRLPVRNIHTLLHTHTHTRVLFLKWLLLVPSFRTHTALTSASAAVSFNVLAFWHCGHNSELKAGLPCRQRQCEAATRHSNASARDYVDDARAALAAISTRRMAHLFLHPKR